MLHHHFLLIAFPVQGHINPALQLAKRLITLGARVTLTTTLHVHRRIANKPTIPGLTFLPYSDGHDDGFTAATDAEYSLYLSDLKHRGSQFVTNLILSTAKENQPITCVIYTLLQTWAADVAREFHLPTAMLWIQPATVFNIFYHYFHDYGNYLKDKITKSPSSPLESIELPGLPSPLAPRDLPSFFLPSTANFVSVVLGLFESQFRELDEGSNPTVLVNTFEALEAESLMAIDEFNFNMVPIGPLIPSAYLDGGDLGDTSFGGDVLKPSEGYLEWLDTKAEKSVVYVSFGSLYVLSKRQTEEIARALLDGGRPFLWVVREEEEEEEEEELWGELEEKGGKVVKWCCQVEVLSHGSLGCFVTHCGWNSTLESLVSGVPVVAFPQGSEQSTNAKLIEDVWKTGVRVNHTNEEGVVEAAEIRRCLDLVMGSGEELRRNAKKWKGLAMEAVREGGSSDKNLKNFVDDVGKQSLRVGEKLV